MPDTDHVTPEQIQKSLDDYLAKSKVCGFIITGFDKDHACTAGVEYVLSKYQPKWIMYPKYFKDTDVASEVFAIISAHEKRRENTENPLARLSVRVDRIESRVIPALANWFKFELFSPHMDDMDCSNNCSIVLKLTGVDAAGFSYLITGDTETSRWENINRYFGGTLASDVMAAPHHGSISGVNAETLLLVQPDTVLISAGVDNPYGHPDAAAVKAYGTVAKHVYSTNASPEGCCFFTRLVGTEYQTIAVQHPAIAAPAVT
jgi:beta-lactamase superfamily II metal-dependent hydrolase